ncbi:hypothetical protein BGZ83_000832 [Gryganskiella cystojenkinii]|nr:hypothetical protein BGZ83_000832 [Gryganskiella cystojenkinii]
MVPEAKSRASSNDGNYNTFDDDDDMPIPGTPSKRRRVESTKSVAADLNAFDKDVPLNDENPFMVTAAPPVPKAVRSPGLTLEDLRAPTPKILRTTGGTSTMAMPMMLMHTPQQKLLFQEEMARLSKPSRPFPGLTTPSAPTSDANPFSVSDSPPKKSAFSSSIFSRFRSGHGGGLSKGLDLDRSPISTPTKSSMALSLITPETPSVPGAITSTIRVSPTVVTSAGPDQDQRIIKSSNTRSFSDLSTTATATEMTILPAPKQSTAEQPAPVVPRSTAQDLNRHLPIPSPSLAMPVEIDATFDPTASRNPWGRPPSWKPKSPRMIDMEKKILAEQKARLAASTASSVESPLEPLSAFGSLKVSVYGRADRTKSLSMSSASLSASSLSMTSSRSDRSVHGHPASSHLGASIVESPVEYQVFGESTGRLNIVEDEDTREFSPPAVSPIKNALGDFPVPVLATSTTSSLFKIPTRSTTYGSKSRLVTAIVSRESAQPVSSNNRAAVKGTVQRVSKPIREATNQDQLPQPRGYHKGELLEQQDRAEKLKMENASILDQPTLQDHDFDDERKGEDETVLNFALQPIFGGTGTSKSRRNGFNFSHKTANNRDDHEHDQEFSFGGLFDEDMPEGLDPDEALYDNTEQFS